MGVGVGVSVGRRGEEGAALPVGRRAARPRSSPRRGGPPSAADPVGARGPEGDHRLGLIEDVGHPAEALTDEARDQGDPAGATRQVDAGERRGGNTRLLDGALQLGHRELHVRRDQRLELVAGDLHLAVNRCAEIEGVGGVARERLLRSAHLLPEVGVGPAPAPLGRAAQPLPQARVALAEDRAEVIVEAEVEVLTPQAVDAAGRPHESERRTLPAKDRGVERASPQVVDGHVLAALEPLAGEVDRGGDRLGNHHRPPSPASHAASARALRRLSCHVAGCVRRTSAGGRPP